MQIAHAGQLNKKKAKGVSDNGKKVLRKRDRVLLWVKDLEIESEEKTECGRVGGGTHSCVRFNSFPPRTNITVSFPQKIKSVKSAFVVCGSVCMNSSESLQKPQFHRNY